MKGLYEQSVLPMPFTVLGRQLKPFSFGHFLILRRFDVGFVSDSETKLTLEDIVFSIFVCSHSYQEIKEKIYRGDWLEQVKSWGEQVRAQCEKFIPKGGTLADTYIDWGEKSELFHRYIEHHTARPYFKPRRTGDEGESNAEWYEGILKTLMGQCGYTHDEVMNLSFSRALYEYLSYLEQQGVITFYNDRQENQLKAILDRRRKERNGQS